MRAGDLLFRWRGELAVPFIAAAIWAGRPVAATFLAGLAISALGESIRLGALRHIGPKSRRVLRTGSHAVVRSGPYGWTRNPLYLGNLVMATGVLVALNQPLLLLGGVVLISLYYRAIIGAEERALAKEFGDEYRRYLEEVPRLFPRPPRTPGGPARHRLRDVILPELNTIVTFEFAFAAAGALEMVRRGFPGT